jgi:hypothetical protein
VRVLDQAAGLRRRKVDAPPHCILGVFESGDTSRRLAHALHAHSLTSLLVDATGRLQSDAVPRSLFEWRQQLERGQAHLRPQPYGDDWHAPGVEVNASGLVALARRYAAVVFDLGPRPARLGLMTGARHSVVLEVGASPDARQAGYTLLKTVAHASAMMQVGLLGDRDGCRRVSEACARFLGDEFAQAMICVAGEDEPFGALAVRMMGEETGSRTRYKTGKPLNHGR